MNINHKSILTNSLNNIFIQNDLSHQFSKIIQSPSPSASHSYSHISKSNLFDSIHLYSTNVKKIIQSNDTLYSNNNFIHFSKLNCIDNNSLKSIYTTIQQFEKIIKSLPNVFILFNNHTNNNNCNFNYKILTELFNNLPNIKILFINDDEFGLSENIPNILNSTNFDLIFTNINIVKLSNRLDNFNNTVLIYYFDDSYYNYFIPNYLFSNNFISNNLVNFIDIVENYDLIICENINLQKILLKNFIFSNKSQLIEKIKLFNFSLVEKINLFVPTHLPFVSKKYKFLIIANNFNCNYTHDLFTTLKLINNSEQVLLVGSGSKSIELKNNYHCIDGPMDKINFNNLLKNVDTLITNKYFNLHPNFINCLIFNNINIVDTDELNKSLILFNQLNFFNINELFILDFYSICKYEQIQKITHFFKYINLNLHWILLNNSMCVIKNNSNIKILNYSKKIFIDNYIHNINPIRKKSIIIINCIFNNVLKSNQNIAKLIEHFNQKIILYNYFDTFANNYLEKKIKIFTNNTKFNCNFLNGIMEYSKKLNNIKFTFNLNSNDIDIYFISSQSNFIKQKIFKQILFDKIKFNRKIIFNINSSDINCNWIFENINLIDWIIFDSELTKNYYFNKYAQIKTINFQIIPKPIAKSKFKSFPTNPTDPTDPTNPTNNIRIITNLMHCADSANSSDLVNSSDLINSSNLSNPLDKNYYSKISKYLVDNPNTNIKFTFSKNCIEQINEYNIFLIIGLSKLVDENNIEIKIDNFNPIAITIPVLYLDTPENNNLFKIKEFGLSAKKIGESFNNFDEMFDKLNLIISNYDLYEKNIIENIYLYNSNNCYKNYFKIFYFIK